MRPIRPFLQIGDPFLLVCNCKTGLGLVYEVSLEVYIPGVFTNLGSVQGALGSFGV